MPADVLRDREIQSATKPAEIPGPPPPPEAPKPDAGPTLTGYAAVYAQELEKIRPKYEAATKLAREDLERRKQEIADYKQRVLSSPLAPAPPELPTEPPSPVLSARPFLDTTPGESWQSSLQKLMMGMGLMAQMAVGIKGGFPGGALAAYTGALNGWAEGDHIRAANEWKTYMGQLQQYDRSVGRVQQDFENAMRTWGHDQDRLKTEFGILAAEHGLSREGIELAFKEPDQLLGQLNTSMKMLEMMQRDAQKAAFDNAMFMFRAHNEEENRALRRDLAQQARDDRQARQDEALQMGPAGGAFYDSQTDTFLPAVSKGELKKDPGRFKSLNAQNMQLVEFLDGTKPQIELMRTLVKGLAAENPGMNLYRAVQLAGEGKLAMNPALRQMMLTNRDVLVELTRALGGGGQLRIQLMKALEQDVGFKPEDTVATANVAIDTLARTLENRRLTILGKKPVPFEPAPTTIGGTTGAQRRIIGPDGKEYNLAPGYDVPSGYRLKE